MCVCLECVVGQLCLSLAIRDVSSVPTYPLSLPSDHSCAWPAPCRLSLPLLSQCLQHGDMVTWREQLFCMQVCTAQSSPLPQDGVGGQRHSLEASSRTEITSIIYWICCFRIAVPQPLTLLPELSSQTNHTDTRLRFCPLVDLQAEAQAPGT